MTHKKCASCESKFENEKFAPFCSKRCADVDLHRWMQGSYVIPGAELGVTENAPSYRSPQDDER